MTFDLLGISVKRLQLEVASGRLVLRVDLQVQRRLALHLSANSSPRGIFPGISLPKLPCRSPTEQSSPSPNKPIKMTLSLK